MIQVTYAAIINGDYTNKVFKPSKKKRIKNSEIEYSNWKKELIHWLQKRYNKMFRMECIFTEID